MVREVDRAEERSLDEHRPTAAAGEERTGEDVLRGGQCEHERHHSQQQAADPQGTGARPAAATTAQTAVMTNTATIGENLGKSILMKWLP